MNKQKAIIIYSILLLISCNEESIYDYNYTGDLYFTLTNDTLATQQNGLEWMLRLETVETFRCSNFSIVTEIEKEIQFMDIQILDIYAPDVCATAIGPAIVWISVDLENPDYTLSFNNGQFLDTYRISLEGDFVIVEENDSHFTEYYLYGTEPEN